VRATDQGDRVRVRKATIMCCKRMTRIVVGNSPFYLRRQRLKRAIFLAVCADGNNQLGLELLACSQRMNRDITSSASSPPTIDINSMWACWPISQSVPSCAFCKHLMIGWSASTNNIIQGRGGSKVWARIPGLLCPSTFFFPQNKHTTWAETAHQNFIHPSLFCGNKNVLMAWSRQWKPQTFDSPPIQLNPELPVAHLLQQYSVGDTEFYALSNSRFAAESSY
jgi:hypothetical protein